MKIIEPQSAVLSNAEVLAHLNGIASRRREQAGPSGVPALKSANFETVVRELTAYLSPPSSSAAQQSSGAHGSGAGTAAAHAGGTESSGSSAEHPLPPYAAQDAAVISRVVKRLAPFNLTKGEVLMVLNLRPSDPVLLDLVVEECDGRLSSEQQQAVVDIVAEELGGGAEAEAR